MENITLQSHHAREAISRTLVKTFSYRLFILVLDFLTIYIFTGQAKIAFGFMIVSNIYTTVAYFVHERIWERVTWGKQIIAKQANE